MSNYKTIINTIKNDSYTFEWLNYFIWQPQVKPVWQQKLTLYVLARPLRRTEAFEIIYKILILISLGVFIVTRHIVFFLLILPISGLLATNQRTKKQIVVKIGATLLREEFDEHFFEEKTLYSLTEILSNKYNTDSLLDCIFFTENIFRTMLIGLFLLFISPFSQNNIVDGLLSFGLLFLLGGWLFTNHHIYHFSKILHAV